jgi:hypothetical protein
MPTVRVNWQELKGRQLETIWGARFTVVRVTNKHVTIRPERGRRTYTLSIPDELERGVAVYAGVPVLPPPAELSHIGVRPILLSYVWGVLKAVLVDGLGARTIGEIRREDFEGFWQITGLPDMDESYVEEGDGAPEVQIWAPTRGSMWGSYQIGLSNGSLHGDTRDFGGELILVFGYEGTDEMEPASGGGWMRLIGRETLEGEFIGTLGRFTAEREKIKAKPAKRSKRPPHSHRI